jgi:hypothetical protein
MHVIGRRLVAGDCRDGAHLFVACQQQEARRAAVALAADRIEAGFRMRQFTMPVRRRRATGMQVRIDQGAEGFRAFKPGIEIETQFARQRLVRTLPGSGDDPIDRPNLGRTANRLAVDDNPVVFCVERQNSESGFQGHAFTLDKLFHIWVVGQLE